MLTLNVNVNGVDTRQNKVKNAADGPQWVASESGDAGV